MHSQKLTFVWLVAFIVGCGQNSGGSLATKSLDATPVAFNVAGAPTVEFSVPDMMCPEGCGAKTQEILSKMPGAKEVVINFEGKSATVAVDQDKFDADAAIAALVDYGFEHSTLKADSRAAGAVDATEPLETKPAG